MTTQQQQLFDWLVGLSEQEYKKSDREHIAKQLGMTSAAELDAAVATARAAKRAANTLNWHRSSEPMESAETPFIVDGLIYQGSSTALIAKPKVGKTTLTMDLCDASIRNKKFLGRNVLVGNIIYVTEQPINSFRAELRNSELLIPQEQPNELYYVTIGDWFKLGWTTIIDRVGEQASTIAAKLVIFDTLSRIARVADENSASEMQEAVDKLSPLHSSGISTLLVQHERKSGGDISDAGRGTNALTGAVDVLLRLGKTGGKGRSNFRTLEYLGRFPGPAEPLVIYRATQDEKSRYELADLKTAKQQMIKLVIQDALAKEASPLTEKEIVDILKENDVKASRTTVRRTIDDLLKDGLIEQSGDGSRATPFVYAEPIFS
jgi:AAA domain